MLYCCAVLVATLLVLSRLSVAPVALGSVRDLQWYFPLAAEGGCISKLRWIQALCSLGTTAESIVILLCVACCLPSILYCMYSKHSSQTGCCCIENLAWNNVKQLFICLLCVSKWAQCKNLDQSFCFTQAHTHKVLLLIDLFHGNGVLPSHAIFCSRKIKNIPDTDSILAELAF